MMSSKGVVLSALSLVLLAATSSTTGKRVFLAFGPAYSQPTSGDWVVTGEEVVENKTVTLEGNLIVKSGGNLTLRSVNLSVKSSYIGQYQISAEQNSSIYIYDSTIMPTDERYGPSFRVEGAKLVLKGNTLQATRGTGDRGEWFTLLGVDNPVIENNTITINGGETGIESTISLRECRNAVIRNNVIKPIGQASINLFFNNLNDTIVTGSDLVFTAFIIEGSWNSSITNNIMGVKPGVGPASGLVMSVGCGNNVVSNNQFNSLHEYASVCTAFRLVGTTFPNAFTNNVIRGSKGTDPMFSGFRTGVLISQSSNAIIANNSFIEFPRGYEDQYEALQVYRSDGNLILNNYINSTNSGIILFASSNNTLKGNRVSDSGRGIGLYYSSDNNIVEKNSFENNLINVVFDGVVYNTVRTNSFIISERQAYDDSSNFWIQNYWSDYSGKDRGDGIGDSPYQIPSNGTDNTPLISKPVLISEPTPTLEPASYENVFLENRTAEHILDHRVIKDQTIILTEAINIEEGGSLILENVTVTATPSKNVFEYGFHVGSGASLQVNGSKIIGGEKGPAINFDVQKGAKFTITNSELYNLGGPWTQGGPAIQVSEADSVVIENNTLVGSKQAMYIVESSRTHIVNNTISKSLFGIDVALEYSLFIDNRISEAAHWSLVIRHSYNSIIVGNTISDVWGYMGWWDLSNSLFENNTILNYMGGYWSAHVTIEGCDSNGLEKDTFDLHETVFVNGSGYESSKTYNVYVVGDVAWTDGMAIPSRVPGTGHEAHSDSSGNIPPTPVWSSPLVIGKYDIVVDVNGNGQYNEGIDALDDNDIQATAGTLVIPEFSSFITVSLFLLATLLAVTIYKRK